MPKTSKRVRQDRGTPEPSWDEAQATAAEPASLISALPEAVLLWNVIAVLDPPDLCSLLVVNRKLRDMVLANDTLLFQRHVPSSNIVLEAVHLAGSWRKFALQKERQARLNTASPSAWQAPCDFELQATTNRVAAATQGADNSHLIFLLDGSGSVGEEEFDASTAFILRCAQAAKAQALHECKVQVAQFSTDVKTEWEDMPGSQTDADAFEKAVKGMIRMNGGTNIAAALTHAGKSLKKLSAGDSTAKVIVLITDGRVDGHQAREARQVAAMLADEQPTVTLFAYGVGRGIDRKELLDLVAAAPASKTCRLEDPQDRYMDLFFKEEAPW